MSAHHIILDCLPYLCQKLSKLVEIWRSYDKNNVAFYWDTVYTAGYDVPTQNISVNKIYISTYHWLYCGLMLLVGGCEQMWWLCQTVQYVRRSDNVDSFHGSSQIIRYSLLCLSPCLRDIDSLTPHHRFIMYRLDAAVITQYSGAETAAELSTGHEWVQTRICEPWARQWPRHEQAAGELNHIVMQQDNVEQGQYSAAIACYCYERLGRVE